MTVAEFSFELEQATFRTVRGSLILAAKLPHNEGEILISKKLNNFTIGLSSEERSPVTSITFDKGILQLTYETAHSPFPHTRRIQAKLWKRRPEEHPDDRMTTQEIRGWIDGEGYINSGDPSKNGPHLTITQKERSPLQTIEDKFFQMGIPSRVYYHPSNDSYVLEVLGWENIARVIVEVGPFRTSNRTAQVEEFKRNLGLSRKKTHASTKRARAIVGIC